MNEAAPLIIPAFFAGLLTFLAPCTLPLLPAYLAFISGVSPKELQTVEGLKIHRWIVFKNGLLYVIGFSVVFISFGVAATFLGKVFNDNQELLARIAGIFIIILGLFMLGIFKLKFLETEKHFKLPAFLEKFSSLKPFFVGIAFAVGWTPCVGPILGSILVLAGTTGKALTGGFLLGVFSLGLAIPFLLVALTIGSALQRIKKISRFLRAVSIIGGIFLIGIGILLFINRLDLLIIWGFKLLRSFGYERIYQYL